MARQIIADGGMGGQGIFRGLSSTMMRNGVWNMVYFGMYHSIKNQYQAPKVQPPQIANIRFRKQRPTLPIDLHWASWPARWRRW